MKIKDGFLLRQIAGQTVVVPVGGELDLNMIITLNETGAFLWERMQAECSADTLVNALLETYDVDAAAASQAVARFVQTLNRHGFLE